MKNEIIIFDIDGTLANTDNRQHFVEGKNKDFRSFLAECGKDSPIKQTIFMYNLLKDAGNTMILASGREDSVKDITVDWLYGNDIRDYAELFMRSAKDFRSDSEVKEEILYKIIDKYGIPFCVFDDRPQVVKMWHDKGIFVFNVAQHFNEF